MAASFVTSAGVVRLRQTDPRKRPQIDRFTLSERLEALQEMTVQTKEEAAEMRAIERLLNEKRG